MTKKRGRPRESPKRVTVTLAQHHADALQLLADEAQVTLSAFCAHVLERFAIQDRTLMTNDLLVERLLAVQREHLQAFADQYGEILLRQSHEIVALRRQMLMEVEGRYGADHANSIKELSWQHAVRSLRKQSEKIRSGGESKSESGEIHP